MANKFSMAEHRLQHTQLTCSSVTSSVSTASSGYAIISGPTRIRGDVRKVYLQEADEPPPDYDEEPVPHEAVHVKMNPNRSSDSAMPLLRQQSIPVQEDKKKQILIRINSQSQDVNIEEGVSVDIVSTQSNSPLPLIEQGSPGVLTNLLHGTTKTGTKQKCYKTYTKKEKILIGIVTVAVLALVLVILNFTVCIGGFTSHCK